MHKLRFLFFSFSAADWLWPIEDSIIDLTKELDFEVFFISSRRKKKTREIINFYGLKNSKLFQNFLKLNVGKTKLGEDFLQKHYEFYKLNNRYKKTNKKKIRDNINEWCIQAEFIYKMIEPDFVIIWSGQFGVASVFASIAEKMDIPIIFAEKGVLPQSFYFDSKGINANSQIADNNQDSFYVNPEEITQFVEKIKDIDDKGSSAWKQPKRLDKEELRSKVGIKQHQKVIFFPGQVDFDSNIILFSPHFKRSQDVLKWLSQSLSDDFFILAKPHPKGLDKDEDFDEVIGKKGKSVSNMNVLDAINLSDIVVTINSTVGFESIIRKKPVLQLGDSILSNKNIIKIYDPNENALLQIKKYLKEFDRNKNVHIDLALKFGTYLYHHYYGFKGNVISIKNQLKKVMTGVVSSKKKFHHKEIIFIFEKITADNAWTFLNKKWFSKIIIFFIRIKIIITKVLKLLCPKTIKKIKRILEKKYSKDED